MRPSVSVAAVAILLALTAGCRSTSLHPAVDTDHSHVDHKVAVSFVGCPSDGQQGPQPAPVKSTHPPLLLQPSDAAKLALYEDADGGFALAPRGWHCLEMEGSDGDFLLVVPQPVTAAQIFAPGFKGFTGPAVQVSTSIGDTSGRFEVARLIRRAFPAHEAFADSVLAEGLEDAKDMPAGAFPSDRIIRRSPEDLLYITPPGHEGLGTMTHLLPGSTPLYGYATLTADGGTINSTLVAVRLMPDDPALAQTILQAR